MNYRLTAGHKMTSARLGRTCYLLLSEHED